MSCQIVPWVSFALAATEFHSLSPPCDHSADTPGPLIHQPGAFADGKSMYEGLSSGSCCEVSEMPRMFSASYQRYSKSPDAGTERRGDAEIGTWSLSSILEDMRLVRARARKHEPTNTKKLARKRRRADAGS